MTNSDDRQALESIACHATINREFQPVGTANEVSLAGGTEQILCLLD